MTEQEGLFLLVLGQLLVILFIIIYKVIRYFLEKHTYIIIKVTYT